MKCQTTMDLNEFAIFAFLGLFKILCMKESALLPWVLKQLFQIWQDKACSCCQSLSFNYWKHTNNYAQSKVCWGSLCHIPYIFEIVGFTSGTRLTLLPPPYFLSVSSIRQSKIPEKTIRNYHERVLLYPYTSNSFKLLQNPLNLPSWEFSPAQICFTRCLFYFLNWALPSSFSHPSLNPLIHPLIHLLDLCV